MLEDSQVKMTNYDYRGTPFFCGILIVIYYSAQKEMTNMTGDNTNETISLLTKAYKSSELDFHSCA